ncbi:MAG TPA: OadG family protein [Spirochaetia bacterium]|nr:OadG family protein [Spirochaetales bacterium]HRS66929.1 OadG family protein [Spirochaetia bacterium]HPD79916.1 OadG family protein [Spirochaetales bacterium]HQG40855.1 OadG family protein [Spirochaetales bacterium]HQK33524.1 OadG family protein [Spirochaetales bacterium]
MISAWTVLIIGIGTVFLGLIFIIVLIVLLRSLLSPKKVRSAESSQAVKTNSTEISSELVAVISAAIAAMMNTSVHNIYIASIQKADTPAWALAERFSRKSKGTLLR